MKINNKLTLSVNPYRQVAILTRRGSNYDRKYLQHEGWFLPVFDCSFREAINHLKALRYERPNYRINKM